MVEESKQGTQNAEQENASATPAGAAEGVLDPETASFEDLKELLEQKEEEIKRLHDRVLRTAADLDNTRKRLEREKSEGICYANESLIRELLPVLDNLDRAIQHGESDPSLESLLEGVIMTRKSFLDILARFGCTPIEAIGKGFDPNFHEAMMQQESTEQPDNMVIQEFRKGYTLNDRLIRPAMVVVSKKPKAE